MANPKPVYTLTRWKVLSNEEASELIDTGRMQRRVETPMGAKSLTNKQIYDMQQGQPLFVVSKGQYMMLAWQNGQVVAYEVEERKPKPPKSFAQKAREFFRGMFPLMVEEQSCRSAGPWPAWAKHPGGKPSLLQQSVDKETPFKTVL